MIGWLHSYDTAVVVATGRTTDNKTGKMQSTTPMPAWGSPCPGIVCSLVSLRSRISRGGRYRRPSRLRVRGAAPMGLNGLLAGLEREGGKVAQKPAHAHAPTPCSLPPRRPRDQWPATAYSRAPPTARNFHGCRPSDWSGREIRCFC